MVDGQMGDHPTIPQGDSMAQGNYYTLLGVTPAMDQNQIKRAYHRLVRQCHPDLNPDLPDAEERLRSLIEAYQAVREDISRTSSDRMLDILATPRFVPRCTFERMSSLKAMLLTLALAVAVLFAGGKYFDGSAALAQADMSAARRSFAELTSDQIASSPDWVARFAFQESRELPTESPSYNSRTSPASLTRIDGT